MADAIVIGCGIIGLSSAIRLLEAGFSVQIMTRDLPQDTTSAVAGAIWAGHLLAEDEMAWSAKTLGVLQAQAHEEDSGVQITRYRELFYHQEEAPWFSHLLDYCMPLPATQLPEGYVSGYISDIPLIQTPAYLEYLLQKFSVLGGTLIQREIQSLSELSDYPLLINCTGVDARHVASDKSVYPIQGQVLLCHAPHIAESTMDDEQFTYVFPRKDGVILGGTHADNRWERQPDDTVTSDIMTRCQKLVPDLNNPKIKKVLVGLRPGRSKVRLEQEQLHEGCTVIHNYGHRGIGYTLAWGCAEKVVTLAKNAASP